MSTKPEEDHKAAIATGISCTPRTGKREKNMTNRLILAILIMAVGANAAAQAPNSMDAAAKLLEELSNAHGPSGFEGPVRTIIRREMGPLADRIEIDGLGSVISIIEHSQDAPNIMIAAHMDEVGMMVKRITDDGYLKYQVLGGILPQALLNQRFRVLTAKGYVIAISGLKTIHVIPRGSERSLVPEHNDIFLDVGASSREDAMERLGIRPGNPIAPDTEFEILNGSELYVGKAWDDRVGLAVMIEVMKRLKNKRPPANVYFVATTQEEIGLRGAHTSSYLVKPDIGISLEAGVAADYPGISLDEAQEILGNGPGMFLFDASMIPNDNLKNLVIDLAARNKIPLQFNVQPGYGEDGAEMQKAFAGTPSVNLTVPTRYLHTHYGVINRNDFDGLVELLTATIYELTPAKVKDVKRF
jgi:putative aminopeptidase FrvX|tara:strand:- start:373 stop:1617 length:1245 start_codon:yes stop_codon:yes gene_type:complete